MNVIALCLALAATPETTTEPDKIVHARKTLIEFSELEISGKIVGPEGDFLRGRKKAKFNSLIRIRNSYGAELEASVDKI
jgi:hypothetical protein